MRALVFEQFGGPEVLHVRELPDPVPATDEVLVRTRAIGLNFADIYRRKVTTIWREIRHGSPATKLRAKW